MRIRFFFFLLAVGLIFSCTPKVTEVIEETPPPVDTVVIVYDTILTLDTILITPPPPYIAISLKKSYCYGNCPQFTAEFYSNGRIVYKGERHVENIGTYETTVDSSVIQNLLNYADQINYFGLKPMYPSYGPIMYDFPATITYIRKETDYLEFEEKTVTNKHNSPVSLQKFERYIQAIIDQQEWTKQ